MQRKALELLIVVFVLTFLYSSSAKAGVITFYDANAYGAAAGPLTPEGFETVKWDSWIYHTRLPSPIAALDLDDDPNDPDDGPDYDLDGHFQVTGNSIAYAPPHELFKVIRDGNGNQFLSFAPWYNILWPQTFDPNDTHPIVTFDNFNDAGDSITAFGLTFYDYTPSPNRWIVMELGGQFAPVNFSGPRGNYFVGFVSDTPFDFVRFHTNQNGSRVDLDSLTYHPAASVPIPEPSTILIWLGVLGGVGAWSASRKRR